MASVRDSAVQRAVLSRIETNKSGIFASPWTLGPPMITVRGNILSASYPDPILSVNSPSSHHKPSCTIATHDSGSTTLSRFASTSVYSTMRVRRRVARVHLQQLIVVVTVASYGVGCPDSFSTSALYVNCLLTYLLTNNHNPKV